MNRKLASVISLCGVGTIVFTLSRPVSPIAVLPMQPVTQRQQVTLINSRFDMAHFRATALVEVKVESPPVTEPSDSTIIVATVTLQSVRLEASGSRNFDMPDRDVPSFLRDRLQRDAESQIAALLKEGKLGLTLQLSGADVRPEKVAPIVNGHAEWSVKAKQGGRLQGFVSPVLEIVDKDDKDGRPFNPSGYPAFELSSITTTERVPVVLTARESAFNETIKTTLAVLGSLATIPGIFAFYLDIRRRREEKDRLVREEAERATQARQREEEERARERRERRIVVAGEDPRG